MDCIIIALFYALLAYSKRFTMVHSFTHWQVKRLTVNTSILASHIHTPMVATTGGKVGFSVLPKDTSTCGQEEPEFEPPTHGATAPWLREAILTRNLFLELKRRYESPNKANIPLLSAETHCLEFLEPITPSQTAGIPSQKLHV